MEEFNLCTSLSCLCIDHSIDMYWRCGATSPAQAFGLIPARFSIISTSATHSSSPFPLQTYPKQVDPIKVEKWCKYIITVLLTAMLYKKISYICNYVYCSIHYLICIRTYIIHTMSNILYHIYHRSIISIICMHVYYITLFIFSINCKLHVIISHILLYHAVQLWFRHLPWASRQQLYQVL